MMMPMPASMVNSDRKLTYDRRFNDLIHMTGIRQIMADMM